MINHIPCMAHVIQHALGAFMSRLGDKGRTKSWEAHERTQQFGENESTDIWKCQRPRKQGNARINMVSAMRPCVAKLIGKVRISRHYETPETDRHIVENAWFIEYPHNWLSKGFHWLLPSQSTNHCTTNFGCENTVGFDSGVASASLQITRNYPQVAQRSKLQWIPATLHNTGWMHHQQVIHIGFKAILILDSVVVKKTYGYSALHHHGLQWHVRPYGWRFPSFSWEVGSMKAWLILRSEVCATEAFKYYAEVTPKTGMLLIWADILDCFWKLWSLRKWDKGMENDPEDNTSYTTQYQEAFLKYIENKYFAKHSRISIIKPANLPGSNLFPSANASAFGQSSFDPYDLSSNDEEYMTPKCMAETTHGGSDRAPRSLTAIRLYLNSPPEAPKNEQVNPNPNDYHSNRMEINSTFWLPHIAD